MTCGKPKASWVYALVCQLGANWNESEKQVACPPPTHVPLPEASFSGLRPSQGPLQGWQLLGDRVRTEAQGSRSRGRARCPRSAAPAAPLEALRLGACSAREGSQQLRYSNCGRVSKEAAGARSRRPLAPRLPWDHPLAPQRPRSLPPTPPTSLIKPKDCILPTLLWLVRSRGLGGPRTQAVQQSWVPN